MRVPKSLHPVAFKEERLKLCQFLCDWCAENKIGHGHNLDDEGCCLSGDRKEVFATIRAHTDYLSRAYVIIHKEDHLVVSSAQSASELKEQLSQLLPVLNKKQSNLKATRHSARLANKK
jgi:hypothetical protein